jgi:threonyl-tRNA synthetase
MTDELVGPGLPLLLPDGATIKDILERYIRDKETALGYTHVATPSLATTNLYKNVVHFYK